MSDARGREPGEPMPLPQERRGSEARRQAAVSAAKPSGMADDATIATLASLSADERQVLLKVSEILKRLQFGTVLLVVQDGKVVQIEMAEKFRLR